jgi:uncharacterized protein
MQRRSKTVLILLALISVTFLISCKRADTPPATKVTVIGEATLNIEPDQAVVMMSVVTQAQTALAAQQQNASRAEAVIAALKTAAGANAEIKTTAYMLEPQNDNRENRLPKIVGYETRNSLTVTIVDLTKVGAVIDAASQAGANSIERVSFGVKDRNAATGRALGEATKEAMTKARSIAEAMGGRVVRLVEEQESPANGGVDTFVLEASTDFKGQTPVARAPIRVSSRVQLIVEIDAQPRM